jgi:lipoprotein NlpD
VASPDGVDVRPLGLDTRNSGSLSGSSTSSGNNKSAPRADKRPYSDAALAELRKNQAVTATLGKELARPGEKGPEKVSNPLNINGNGIEWVWPAEGKVATNFDDNKSKGIDVLGKSGQNIYAAAAGTVMYAGSGIRGYGNLVIIKHSTNFLSAYAHNRTILVKEKQVITKGQKIADMGDSDSDIVKLHFEIRQQGKPVDPMVYLPVR